MERIRVGVGLLSLVLVICSYVLASPVDSGTIAPTQSTIKKFFVGTTKKVTWTEALAECRAQKMALASINSRSEQARVVENIKQAKKPSRGGFWTAGTARDDDVTVYWNTTGSELSHFTNWEEGEPKVFSDFRCLLVNGGSKKWMVHNCTATEFFICESF